MTRTWLFLRFLRVLAPYRGRWAAILTLSGLNGLLQLVNPYLAKLLVDQAIEKKDLERFVVLALVSGGIFIFGALTTNISKFLEKYIRLRTGFDLNRQVYKKMQSLPLAWFKGQATGEHLYKIGYDLDRVIDLVTSVPPRALAIFPQLFLTFAVLFHLNGQLALLAIFLAPFLYIPSFYLIRKMHAVWGAFFENSEKIFKNLEEIFSHIQLVKTFGKETASIRGYLSRLIGNVRINIKVVRLDIASSFISQIIGKVIAGLIVFFGVYQVIQGRLTLGTLTAVMICLSQLMGLQWQVTDFFQTATLGFVSCERVARVLDEKTAIIQLPDAKEVEFHRPEISFKELNFHYRPGEAISKDITFTIKSGEHVAFVGPSGCGKTTILNLILRLYEPSSGHICIDGHNIKNIKLHSLRGQIGAALQEPFLWNDTIANNIRYGKEDATPEEFEKVARLTGMEDLVKDLPGGYDAVIGENGCKLSEGQKQRIAIARALIKKPKILILDEAMSSMDSASEEKILISLKKFKNDMTMITVSHRLSAVMYAEKVCYLKNADKMVIDTPQNLLRDDQDFIRLFAGQESITP